jgi:hypothetical protein
VAVRPFGDGVALGFAPADHDAVALRLDLDTLATTGRANAGSADPIRRVRPTLAQRPRETLVVARQVLGVDDHPKARVEVDLLTLRVFALRRPRCGHRAEVQCMEFLDCRFGQHVSSFFSGSSHARARSRA